MSEEFKIEIVNPEKYFLVKEDVSEVVVPAFEYLGRKSCSHSFLFCCVFVVVFGNVRCALYLS